MPFPDDAVAPVVALVDAVRALGVPGGGRDVRWVRLDGLHLTLRFIGPTPTGARRSGRGRGPRRGTLDRAVRRRHHRRGRVPDAAAAAGPVAGRRRGRRRHGGGVAGRRRGPCVERGWAADDRPFRPHLTLARSDGVPAGAAIATRLIERADELRVRCRVDRIGLFESLTGGGPARYEPLGASSTSTG